MCRCVYSSGGKFRVLWAPALTPGGSPQRIVCVIAQDAPHRDTPCPRIHLSLLLDTLKTYSLSPTQKQVGHSMI